MDNAKQYEMLARLNRREAIECSELAEGDEALILAFYAIRDIKNAAHGRIMYHVDHRIPTNRRGNRRLTIGGAPAGLPGLSKER